VGAMGLAAACILEQDPTGEFRHMIHDEVFEDGKEPTVMELSQLFSETKQKFLALVFKH